MERHDGTLLDEALASDGVIHRRRLVALGVSRHQLRRLTRDGVLRREAADVFVLGSGRTGWLQRLRVAVEHAGPTAVVSHAAACALWELPRIGPGAVEVTLPRRGRRPLHAYGRLHRSRDLGDDQRAMIGSLPVTTPGRTLFDMAPRLGVVLLDECLQDLARRQLVRVDRLREDLDARRRSGLHGVSRMDDLLRAATVLPGADSWLEARFLRLLADHRLPLPETQVWFDVDGVRYRVDACWRRARLIVELKGYATHATRLETTADAAREARLGSLGFEVISFTRDQVVGDPRFVVAQVGRRIVVERAA